MNSPTPSPSDCLDLEDLAAFVDGALSGTARDAVVAHLADCEDCYEVYTETLHVQEDLHAQEDLEPRIEPVAVIDEDEEELAPVLVHPRSRAWMWKAGAAGAVLAAAAMLAFVVRVGLLSLATEEFLVPVGNIATMAQRLTTTPALAEGWSQHGWPTKRGLAPEISATERDNHRRSFRLGVHSIDLETALRMDDEAIATRQTHQIENLIEGIDFSQHWVTQIQDLRTRILAKAPQEELLQSSSELMEEWTHREYLLVDPFYFSFGQWAEGSRLAVLTENLETFSRPDFRKSLRILQKHELATKVSAEVEKIESLIEVGSSEELQELFEEIIRYEGIR